MMCDTNWCTYCDNAIHPYSNSLYCSEYCLRQDALTRHPMLGYDYADLEGFPHQQQQKQQQQQQQQHYHRETTMPYVQRKSSLPTLLHTHAISTATTSSTPITTYALPSLSSSVSSTGSMEHTNDTRRQPTRHVVAPPSVPLQTSFSLQPLFLTDHTPLGL